MIATVSAITLAQDDAGHEAKSAALRTVTEILEAGNLREFSAKARSELRQVENMYKGNVRATPLESTWWSFPLGGRGPRGRTTACGYPAFAY